MAHLCNAAFSQDGQYFAFYHTDGKLKIWDTASGVLKQEYTPNEHLTLPCTALAWVTLPHLTMSPGRKKKRRADEEGGSGSLLVLLGLSSGSVLLYSLTTGTVENELAGPGLAAAVRSLAWAKNDVFSGCADGSIAQWILPTKTVSSKWRAGRSPVTALLAHSTRPWLLSAAQTVTVWDRKRHTELRSFAGHASPVSKLLLVPGGNYVVSVARGDRHINVWPLAEEGGNSREVAASFVLPDQPVHVEVGGDEAGNAKLVAVTEGGAMHCFSHHINGKRLPPMKPHLTVQIAASSAEATDSAVVDSIPILGALVSQDDPSVVHIVHGNPVVLRFEKISVNTSKEVMWLVRQNSRRIGQEQQQPSTSKVKAAGADKAHYVSAAGVKRPRDAGSAKQLPIEQRINNLSMTSSQPEPSSKHTPSSDSLAQLLAQGLQSSDQKLLRGILLTKDCGVVSSTVARLSPAQVPLLVQELAVLVHWRGWKGEAAARWLHSVLVHHGALVLASPELPQLSGPLLGLVEARLAQVAPLARLRGRLSLLLGQLAHGRTAKTSTTSTAQQRPLTQYQDGEESSCDELSLPGDSDSEEHWEEGVAAEEQSEDDDDDDEEEEEDEEELNGGEGEVLENGGEGSSSSDEMETSS